MHTVPVHMGSTVVPQPTLSRCVRTSLELSARATIPAPIKSARYAVQHTALPPRGPHSTDYEQHALRSRLLCTHAPHHIHVHSATTDAPLRGSSLSHTSFVLAYLSLSIYLIFPGGPEDGALHSVSSGSRKCP